MDEVLEFCSGLDEFLNDLYVTWCFLKYCYESWWLFMFFSSRRPSFTLTQSHFAVAGEAIILSDAELDQVYAEGLNFTTFDQPLGSVGTSASNINKQFWLNENP